MCSPITCFISGKHAIFSWNVKTWLSSSIPITGDVWPMKSMGLSTQYLIYRKTSEFENLEWLSKYRPSLWLMTSLLHSAHKNQKIMHYSTISSPPSPYPLTTHFISMLLHPGRTCHGRIELIANKLTEIREESEISLHNFKTILTVHSICTVIYPQI